MNPVTKTACPYCGVGCGLEVSGEGDDLQIHGDTAHPSNYGTLCSKGAALSETLGLEGRLLDARVRGETVSVDVALDNVASTFKQTIEVHGRDAVAFYVSGQLLTEDYYAANKLMKGFIGSANIDTNSRLCMSSSVAGHKRVFGSDTVPGCYEDIDQANLIVLTGSNAAWCHPVLYRRMEAAKENNPDLKIVVIDPRRTATCDLADLHLPLAPGSDSVLFNGLLTWLEHTDSLDQGFIASSTEGFAKALMAARSTAPNVSFVAEACRLASAEITLFYEWFSRTPKTVTCYSQGINQSTSGTDKVCAILNCHLATGRVGKPGMGPFSLTGQPNAMGGREVGGLANTLAAHMDIEDEQARRRVQGFWKSPGIATTPGLKAVDLFDAVASGKVKAIWIMGTNPAASMPNADKVREALKACDFVVVSDCVEETDTTATADVLLPALAWGEKSGTVTNSERRISRQRSFLPAPGDAKADWWLISEVARRMGFEDEFAWTSPSEIFREHATLSGLNNGGSRSFDISAFAAGNEAAYDLMQPVQWPVTDHTTEGTPRLFADGGFFHQGGRAKFQAIEPQAPKNNTSPEYPFRLNTGRTRDQWHTMTRTGLSPRLATHRSEPWCAMNPVDARDKGLVAGDYVRVKSKWGEVLIPIMLTDEQSTGSIFIPIHWTGPFAPSARVGALSNPEVDPWSGQPELKHTPVSVDPADIVWKATVWSRECLDVSAVAYAARANQGPATSWALAGESAPESWTTWARNLLDCDQFAEWLEYEDPIKGLYRCALLRNGQLVSCLLVDSSKRPHAQDWPVTLFDQDALSSTERMSLLAGKPLGAAKDRGAIVCACFGVGSITIVEAIASERLVSVARIGEALKAGTNCGSCKPELRDLLQKHTPLVVSLS